MEPKAITLNDLQFKILRRQQRLQEITDHPRIPLFSKQVLGDFEIRIIDDLKLKLNKRISFYLRCAGLN